MAALNEKRKLSPAELIDLSGKLVEESDPIKVETLKEQIIAGFYGGDEPDA